MNLEEKSYDSVSFDFRPARIRCELGLCARCAELRYPADRAAASGASHHASARVQHRGWPTGVQHPTRCRASIPAVECPELQREPRASASERQLLRPELRPSWRRRAELLAATGDAGSASLPAFAAIRLCPAHRPDGELQRPVHESPAVHRAWCLHQPGAAAGEVRFRLPEQHQPVGRIQHGARPRPDSARRPRPRAHAVHGQHHDQRHLELLLSPLPTHAR